MRTMQTASLIMSIEHLLTGASRFDDDIREIEIDTREILIPLDYSLGDYRVSIMQHSYESDVAGYDENGYQVEQCELMTYRIHK